MGPLDLDDRDHVLRRPYLRPSTRWSWRRLVADHGEETALALLQYMPGLGEYADDVQRGTADGVPSRKGDQDLPTIHPNVARHFRKRHVQWWDDLQLIDIPEGDPDDGPTRRPAGPEAPQGADGSPDDQPGPEDRATGAGSPRTDLLALLDQVLTSPHTHEGEPS